MSVDPSLLARARAWQADDPDPATGAALAALIGAAQDGDPEATAELADAFAGSLEFGTAGLRGRLGPGPNRMNRAVVIRAAAGLADYLVQHRNGPRPPRVAVGHDARHGSRQFALDSAGVFVAAGLEVLLLPRPLPTPVLAWLTRHRGCDAGVMVTASHNPPRDNGYKVYLGGDEGGRLIVSPADVLIAARIAAVASAARVPRAGAGWTVLTESDWEPYLAAAGSVALPGGPRTLRVLATPLHGVGGDVLTAVLGRAGFDDVTLVPSQADPDPDFPTVDFPNPEEPGALDAAIAAATRSGADLVVALDPDADRCAVAVRDAADPRATPSGWRMLTGDELGCLIADHLAPRIARAGGGTLACSIVSSTQLGAIAAAHGLDHVRTLTGFKWISRAPGLAFGYEEALGYCVAPDLVRDKDGLTAAVVACELAAGLRAAGRTLGSRLDDLARRDGVYCTGQLSLRVQELSERGVLLDRLRTDPPAALGGAEVLGLDDLADGIGGTPGTEGLRVRLPDGWVILRPSGTEPKLKVYCEIRSAVTDSSVSAVRRAAHRRLGAVLEDLGRRLVVVSPGRSRGSSARREPETDIDRPCPDLSD